MNKKYKVGLDISSIGYFVILEENKIVDICKVPQKIKDNDKIISNIKKSIEEIKPNLKTKGLITKTKDEISKLEREIISIKDNTPRDIKRVFDWLNNYYKDIECVNIEKPILQSNTPTSIQSLAKMHEYLGIITSVLDLLNIKYNILSIQEWRKKYSYKSPPKNLESKDKREFTKSESIRISEELIENIKDYYILKGCKNINTDICESALLAFY